MNKKKFKAFYFDSRGTADLSNLVTKTLNKWLDETTENIAKIDRVDISDTDVLLILVTYSIRLLT